MTTTAANITDDQINALRAEAAFAGDLEMVDICDTAVRARSPHGALDLADPFRSRSGLSDETDEAEFQAARAECARVISDAEAQS